MTEQTMIERVADAMMTAGRDIAIDEYEFTPSVVKMLARAALEAVREPTHEMASAIDARGADPGLIVNNWYRMIDAALGVEKGRKA